jgi:hypothetical protein
VIVRDESAFVIAAVMFRPFKGVTDEGIPHRFSEQPVELIEPLKSLVLDAAQSYLATGSLPVATLAGPSAKERPPD